jgi:phage shock protein PspC (stress-responsive transcriptional regulator)
MKFIGRMMSVTDGTEADVMSMADRPAGQPERPGPRRLTRSRTDRVIAGVCGGFAAYSGIDANIVRLMMGLAGGAGRHRRAVISLSRRPAGRVPQPRQHLGCR